MIDRGNNVPWHASDLYSLKHGTAEHGSKKLEYAKHSLIYAQQMPLVFFKRSPEDSWLTRCFRHLGQIVRRRPTGALEYVGGLRYGLYRFVTWIGGRYM